MSARTTLIGLAALALLAAGCGGEGGTSASPTEGATTSPEATDSATPEPTTSPNESPTASPSPVPSPELEDGRHFGYIVAMPVGDPTMVRFDLAYFLTGDEANEAAEEHGDEAPVPNDYYIVNDNPRLRWLAVAPDVTLRLVDWEDCCGTFVGDLDTFLESFEAEEYPPGNYKGSFGQYWLVVEDGEVVRIQEQYLP